MNSSNHLFQLDNYLDMVYIDMKRKNKSQLNLNQIKYEPLKSLSFTTHKENNKDNQLNSLGNRSKSVPSNRNNLSKVNQYNNLIKQYIETNQVEKVNIRLDSYGNPIDKSRKKHKIQFASDENIRKVKRVTSYSKITRKLNREFDKQQENEWCLII